MRSLVIYGRDDGTTERFAQAVAEGLGERGDARAVTVADVRPEEVARAHVLVLAAPPAEEVALLGHRLPRWAPRGTWFGRPVAVFGLRAVDGRGTAADELSARLRALGASLVDAPLHLEAGGPDEAGEIVQARLWGRHLHLGERVSVEGE